MGTTGISVDKVGEGSKGKKEGKGAESGSLKGHERERPTYEILHL